jgi:hypothetical protein
MAAKALLDLAYLQRWIRELSLGSDWEQVWREAFPDDAAPAVPGD